MATCATVSLTSPSTERPKTPTRPESPAPHEVWANLCRHCHDPAFDLRLVARFTEVVLTKADCPAASALLPTGPISAEACSAMRPILRCIRLMHLCGFCTSDIELVTAHAAVYLEECLEQLKADGEGSMKLRELSLIVCVLLFIAHSWVLDKTCPLKTWHEHAFAQHCKLPTLNAAILRLMEQRGYVLRVSPEDLEAHLNFLTAESESS